MRVVRVGLHDTLSTKGANMELVVVAVVIVIAVVIVGVARRPHSTPALPAPEQRPELSPHSAPSAPTPQSAAVPSHSAPTTGAPVPQPELPWRDAIQESGPAALRRLDARLAREDAVGEKHFASALSAAINERDTALVTCFLDFRCARVLRALAEREGDSTLDLLVAIRDEPAEGPRARDALARSLKDKGGLCAETPAAVCLGLLLLTPTHAALAGLAGALAGAPPSRFEHVLGRISDELAYELLVALSREVEATPSAARVAICDAVNRRLSQGTGPDAVLARVIDDWHRFSVSGAVFACERLGGASLDCALRIASRLRLDSAPDRGALEWLFARGALATATATALAPLDARWRELIDALNEQAALELLQQIAHSHGLASLRHAVGCRRLRVAPTAKLLDVVRDVSGPAASPDEVAAILTEALDVTSLLALFGQAMKATSTADPPSVWCVAAARAIRDKAAPPAIFGGVAELWAAIGSEGTMTALRLLGPFTEAELAAVLENAAPGDSKLVDTVVSASAVLSKTGDGSVLRAAAMGLLGRASTNAVPMSLVKLARQLRDDALLGASLRALLLNAKDDVRRRVIDEIPKGWLAEERGAALLDASAKALVSTDVPILSARLREDLRGHAVSREVEEGIRRWIRVWMSALAVRRGHSIVLPLRELEWAITQEAVWSRIARDDVKVIAEPLRTLIAGPHWQLAARDVGRHAAPELLSELVRVTRLYLPQAPDALEKIWASCDAIADAATLTDTPEGMARGLAEADVAALLDTLGQHPQHAVVHRATECWSVFARLGKIHPAYALLAEGARAPLRIAIASTQFGETFVTAAEGLRALDEDEVVRGSAPRGRKLDLDLAQRRRLDEAVETRAMPLH